MAAPFVEGGDIRIVIPVVDESTGALTDAAEIVVSVTAPDGTPSTLTLTGGGVVAVSTGIYSAIVASAAAATTAAPYKIHVVVSVDDGSGGTLHGARNLTLLVDKDCTT